MLIEQMADAIVERLRAAIPPEQMQIERMPEKPSRQRFTHPKAAAWVGYNGSKYAAPRDLALPVQERTVRFDVALLVRALNGPKGAGAHIDAIEEQLHGFALPLGGAPLALVDDQFIDHDDGVWRYDIAFEMKTVKVPLEPAAPAVATIQLITLDGLEQTEVPNGG